MLVNLTEYFKSQTKCDTIILPYEGKDLMVDGIDVPVLESEGVETTIKNIENSQVVVSGHGNMKVCMPCDRCLKDVEVTVELDFEYTVNEPDGFHEIDDDEQFFMRDYELDGDELIHNELIMGLPMKVLCKDDCKGICPVCGSNRNKGECGCDTFVPDPRMAAIQDIFNAINKEV